jgi:hypothetical protein
MMGRAPKMNKVIRASSRAYRRLARRQRASTEAKKGVASARPGRSSASRGGMLPEKPAERLQHERKMMTMSSRSRSARRRREQPRVGGLSRTASGDVAGAQHSRAACIARVRRTPLDAYRQATRSVFFARVTVSASGHGRRAPAGFCARGWPGNCHTRRPDGDDIARVLYFSCRRTSNEPCCAAMVRRTAKPIDGGLMWRSRRCS